MKMYKTKLNTLERIVKKFKNYIKSYLRAYCTQNCSDL